MNISGGHFTYAGINSREYGLYFVNIDTTRNTSLLGKTESVNVYNAFNKRRLFVDESYDESSIQFEAEVICDHPIPLYLQREIKKWLFKQNGYKRLYPSLHDDCIGEFSDLVDGEQKRLYLNCRLVNPSKIDNESGVIGYRFTIECDSAMAWQDEITNTFAINNSNTASTKTIQVEVDTDMSGFTYPDIAITCGSIGGSIAIVNNSDDSNRKTSFTNIPANTKITMKPKTGFITSGYYDKFVNKNFVRLVDGVNNITVTGNVSKLEITWQNARFL